MIETKAVFRRKDTEIEATDCVVDKVIRLSGAEFDRFSHNLMREWDFIRDNPIDTIVDADGRYHCLLVLGEGRRDGILVNSEGASYARHSAFLPGASDLLIAENYPSLSELTGKLAAAADYVISQASAKWPEGTKINDPFKYAVGYYHLNSKFALTFEAGSDLTNVFACMLEDRSEIASVQIGSYEFLIDATPHELALGSTPQDVEAEIDEFMEKEFAAWKNLSDGIPGNWCEDKRYRQHKDGALYYIGGETGQYMRITNDGKFTVGTYELARPGIEDAVLLSRAGKQYGSYEQAFLAASHLAGQRFTSDIFHEKPSVLGQIRDARKAPPAPRKQKDTHGHEEPDL